MRSAGWHATLVITNIREADQPELGERARLPLADRATRCRRSTGRRVYTTPDNVTHITPRDPKAKLTRRDRGDARPLLPARHSQARRDAAVARVRERSNIARGDAIVTLYRDKAMPSAPAAAGWQRSGASRSTLSCSNGRRKSQ